MKMRVQLSEDIKQQKKKKKGIETGSSRLWAAQMFLKCDDLRFLQVYTSQVMIEQCKITPMDRPQKNGAD